MPLPGRGRAGEAVRAGDERDRCRGRCRAARPARPRTAATRRARAPAWMQRRRRRPPSARAARASASVSSRVFANGTGVALEVLRQHEVVVVEQRLELGGEAIGVEEVLHAQRAARDLVLVGGPDAAPGRADLAPSPIARLARLVERHVAGQDERARGRDRQARAQLDARGLELADLRPAAPTATARRRCRCSTATPGTQDAGRDQPQHRLACRRSPACGRHCGRPGSARRPARSRSASRRSCPCPRRPTACR